MPTDDPYAKLTELYDLFFIQLLLVLLLLNKIIIPSNAMDVTTSTDEFPLRKTKDKQILLKKKIKPNLNLPIAYVNANVNTSETRYVPYFLGLISNFEGLTSIAQILEGSRCFPYI